MMLKTSQIMHATLVQCYQTLPIILAHYSTLGYSSCLTDFLNNGMQLVGWHKYKLMSI